MSSSIQRLCFASDNTAGAHPRILDAIERANTDWAPAYGGDPWTEKLETRVRELFGPEARPYPVFNGTGANVTAIASMLKPWQAVIATDCSHLHIDECGAFERFSGAKLLTVPSRDGKLSISDIEPFLAQRGDVHRVQPRVISITQSSEHGTLYSTEDIRALSTFAHQNGLLLHVDGARFSNAVAAQGLSLREASADLGIDALSFGGTKNGLLFGELVIFFGKPDSGDYPFARKQGMQLGSKLRYVSAQFLEYFEGELWRENALHANRMAKRLEDKIQGKIKLAYPVESNALFPILSQPAMEKLQKEFYFYPWEPARGIARVMMTFETRPEDVDRFAEAILFCP